MKIAINTIPLLSPLTGIGKYAWQIARALREVSSADEFTYYYGYFSKDLISPRTTVDARYRFKEVVKNLPLLGRAARQMKGTLGRLSPRSFDLYFEPNFIPVGIRARRTVVTVPDFSFRLFPEWHPRDRVEYFEKFFWDKIAGADRIITISDFIRTSAIEEFGFPAEKIKTIHLGIDREVFRTYARPEALAAAARLGLPENFILCVGSLEPRKNLVNLLRAYVALSVPVRRDFKLVLVGFKGWENHVIMDLLEKMKTDVIYCGYVSEEDLCKIYSLASLFVYPTFYEGFGLPPLEAMACGCPVVVSHAASLPEVCGDGAWYVDPHDHESIAAGMEKVLTDDAFKTRLVAKGLARAALFSWERSAREHLDLFAEDQR